MRVLVHEQKAWLVCGHANVALRLNEIYKIMRSFFVVVENAVFLYENGYDVNHYNSLN